MNVQQLKELVDRKNRDAAEQFAIRSKADKTMRLIAKEIKGLETQLIAAMFAAQAQAEQPRPAAQVETHPELAAINKARAELDAAQEATRIAAAEHALMTNPALITPYQKRIKKAKAQAAEANGQPRFDPISGQPLPTNDGIPY